MIRDRLRAVLTVAQAEFGDTERLLGYRLPTECEVHAMAASVAHALEQRAAFAGDDEWHAEIFGTALSAVVRKHSGPRFDGPMFRRAVTIDADGLVREASTAADPLSDPLLPDLPTCEVGDDLEPWFPRADWRWVHGEDGVRSMVNLAPQCRVDIAPQAERTLLLVRYFAVVTEGHPYRVRVWGAGRLLADHLIVLQESRLVRAFVPPGCAEILFDIDAGDDATMDFPWRIRVGVFQQFRTGDEEGDDTLPPTSPAALAAP